VALGDGHTKDLLNIKIFLFVNGWFPNNIRGKISTDNKNIPSPQV
jgi:hypothetical protein